MSNAEPVSEPHKQVNWFVSISLGVIVALIGCAIVTVPRLIANMEAINAASSHSQAAASSGTGLLFSFAVGMATFIALSLMMRK